MKVLNVGVKESIKKKVEGLKDMWNIFCRLLKIVVGNILNIV